MTALHTETAQYDAVVIGAGAAGLSGALMLGRACRRVLLLHGGPTRNVASAHAHGLLGSDGVSPADLQRTGLEQLRPYGVDVWQTEVQRIQGEAGAFDLSLGAGTVVRTRAVLLATGLLDVLPDLPRLAERWGRSVHHCPYCHGWEVRGEPLAVLCSQETGAQEESVAFSLTLLQWSRDVTLLLAQRDLLTPTQHQELARQGVRVVVSPISGVSGPLDGPLTVELTEGPAVNVMALFVRPSQLQRSSLAAELGCELSSDGSFVQVGAQGATSVPGIYAAGDMCGTPSQLIFAAASGAAAAALINQHLSAEDRRPEFEETP